MAVNREKTLRIFLESKLDEINSRHFYESSTKTAVYPYLTYVLEESFDDGLTEIFNLVIDGWDNKTDTTDLVQLMSDVDNKFHRLKGRGDGLFFTLYRSGRRSITDSDKRLRRRQIEFEVKVMGGNR